MLTTFDLDEHVVQRGERRRAVPVRRRSRPRGPGTVPVIPLGFDQTVAWLATVCSKTAVVELMRITSTFQSRVARSHDRWHHPYGWYEDGIRMVGRLADVEKTEKITINIG